jgi:hypothetical protein
MAARRNLTQLPRTREKIRTTMLINRLQDFVLGKCTMTPSQVRAARLVPRKILSDLKPVKAEYEAEPSYVDAIRASYRCDQQKIEGSEMRKDAKTVCGEIEGLRAKHLRDWLTPNGESCQQV